MKVKYEKRRFLEWPADVRRRLRQLSFIIGGMRYELSIKDANPITSVAFCHGVPVGWALITISSCFGWGKGTIMVYVKKALRRKGIGRELVKVLKRHRPKTGVSHDDISHCFWHKIVKTDAIPKRFRIDEQW